MPSPPGWAGVAVSSLLLKGSCRPALELSSRWLWARKMVRVLPALGPHRPRGASPVCLLGAGRGGRCGLCSAGSGGVSSSNAFPSPATPDSPSVTLPMDGSMPLQGPALGDRDLCTNSSTTDRLRTHSQTQEHLVPVIKHSLPSYIGECLFRNNSKKKEKCKSPVKLFCQSIQWWLNPRCVCLKRRR